MYLDLIAKPFDTSECFDSISFLNSRPMESHVFGQCEAGSSDPSQHSGSHIPSCNFQEGIEIGTCPLF